MGADGFGKRVKQAREARGLSMGELERRVGIKSRGYISRIEAGQRGKRPSDEIVNGLVRELAVSREWLVEGDAVAPLLTPFVTGAGAKSRRVEVEDPYPSRARFMIFAREEGLDEGVLAALRTELAEGGDPGAEHWRRLYSELRSERKLVAALKNAPTEDPSSAEVLARRAKKR